MTDFDKALLARAEFERTGDIIRPLAVNEDLYV
jgi:hypothetical protein